MSKINLNSKIINDDVYRYIANNSSLTKGQVKECFKTYGDMMSQLLDSKYREDDLVISVPYLGSFYFKHKKGRPKGSTYKIPTYHGSKETRIIELEESEPSFAILKFKPLNTLTEILKKATTHYE